MPVTRLHRPSGEPAVRAEGLVQMRRATGWAGIAGGVREGVGAPFFVALGACAELAGAPEGTVHDERGGLASQSAAVVGGAASPVSEDSVVLLAHPDGTCSGTLVAPNLVLTARHCVSITDGHVSCAADGRALADSRIYADRRPAELGVFVGGRRDALRATAVGSRIIHDGATQLCDHDLAFLVLDRAVPGVRPAPLRRSAVSAGEALRAVGWGLDDAGEFSAERLSRGGITVVGVGPSPILPPRSLMTGESICAGDSGGPLLSASGAVVAVASYGGNALPPDPADASGCSGEGAYNVFSVVAGFGRVIDEAFRRAGAQPSFAP